MYDKKKSKIKSVERESKINVKEIQWLSTIFTFHMKYII